MAEPPGRCHSLSTGASRGQRRRAGVSKGQQWGKKRTITSTPSCPDPPLLPGRAHIFPWDPWDQGTPLSHSSHSFPKLRSPTRCSSRIREQELSHPAGGPRPLEGPPIPLSSFTGAPGLGHTPIPQKTPQKNTPGPAAAPHRSSPPAAGGDSPASSAPLRPYPADFPGTSRLTPPPVSPTAPRGRSSELGVPPVLPPPSPRQRRAARPHRSAPLPARPRPVPPQFGGGGGQRVGMGAGPVGLKLLRVSSGFPPGFFLHPPPVPVFGCPVAAGRGGGGPGERRSRPRVAWC